MSRTPPYGPRGGPLVQSNADRRRLFLRELGRGRHVRIPGFGREYLAQLFQVLRDQQRLQVARAGSDTCWVEPASCAEPLVTIRIATKDRPDELIDRAVASALRQTYEHTEILVVGDACDERTGRAIQQLNNPKVRWINLPVPGAYPASGVDRWRVAGTKPMNAALQLAAGAWIAPCDDDDELTAGHVEQLLAFARNKRLEFVWSDSEVVTTSGIDRVGGFPLARGCTTHGAVMYSMGLSFMRYAESAYAVREPADWNLWKRMAIAGVRMGYLPEVTYRYWLNEPSATATA